MKMRKILGIMMCGLLLSACELFIGNSGQLSQVERMMEQQPDSALALLEQIPPSLLNTEKEQALYHLLMTQARYKLYQPIADTEPIDQSIRYFEKTEDRLHLAAAYYYKGVVVYDLSRNDEAVAYLKKAEELVGDQGTKTETALESGEELLRNKIFEEMHHINLHSENLQLALSYSRRFLLSSLLLDNQELVCRAYDDIALDFSRLEIPDSTRKYRELCLNLMRRMKRQDPYYFANYANDLIEVGDYAEAKEWLQKAMTLKPMANQYVMAGIIAQKEGDTLAARRNWEKAITFGDLRFTMRAYRLLSRLSADRGDYRQAFRLMQQADSIKDIYHEQAKTTQLAEIQQKYDQAIAERAMVRHLNLWLTVLTVALFGIVILMGFTLYYKKKVRRYESTIGENMRQTQELNQKIELLQSTGHGFETEISELKRQIEQLKDASAEKLGRGKEVYNQIEQGQRLSNFTVAKEQDFIDFYAFTYNARYLALTSPYRSLTLRQTTYLILCEMGKGDKEIQELLNVTDSTIRSYRHRLGSRTHSEGNLE